MATTGVMRPGHMQVRVLDLDESVNFYKNVLGLVETGRDATGRVYFKAWDEHDHNSVILRQAESAGMDFIGFKVRDKFTLEKLDADLQAYGVKTERIPAGDLLETGERVRFVIPTGHTMELYAEKSCVGNSQGDLNPDPWTPESEHGIAPVRFDHALLYGPDIDGNLKLFTEVLGFYLVERVLLEDGESLLAIEMIASLDLGAAEEITDLALAEAARAGVNVCVAVVDRAGYPLVFKRQPGAPFHAIDKAYLVA